MNFVQAEQTAIAHSKEEVERYSLSSSALIAFSKNCTAGGISENILAGRKKLHLFAIFASR